MKRDEVLERLRLSEAELRAKGVVHAALFGSLARGEERPESDIDIMVELAPEADARMGLFEYVGIVNFIEDMFSIRVDISNRATLRGYVRPSAERDAVYAF